MDREGKTLLNNQLDNQLPANKVFIHWWRYPRPPNPPLPLPAP